MITDFVSAVAGKTAEWVPARSSFSRSTAVDPWRLTQLAVFNVSVDSGSIKHTHTSRVVQRVSAYHMQSTRGVGEIALGVGV